MPPIDNASRRHGANAAISVLGLSAQQLSAFVITLLAAGFLSAAEYGIYTLAVVFVEFIVMLTYTGFFHFVVNSEAEDREVLPTMFWVMLAIGILGGGALFLGADFLASVFDTPELSPILRLFGLMQPFASAIGWASAYLTRAGLMRRYFLILIATNTFALVMGCVVLVVWQSLYALVLYRAARIIFSLFLFGIAVPTLPRFHFNTTLFRQAWRYAIGLYGARTLTFFSTFGADLVLAFLFSTTESGLYRFANRLAVSTVDIIAQPLRSFALKSFGHAARNGKPLTPVFTLYFPSMLFLMGGFSMTVFILGGAMIDTFFRPEYLMAIGAMQALSLRACASVGQSLIEPTFAATKRTKVAFYNNLVLTIAMVATILGFAPLGFEGVAWAQAVLQCVSIPVSLWVISRWSPIQIASGVKGAMTALSVLACYSLALWLVWQFVGQADITKVLQLGLGISCAMLFGAITTGAAYRLGVLNPQIFSD